MDREIVVKKRKSRGFGGGRMYYYYSKAGLDPNWTGTRRCVCVFSPRYSMVLWVDMLPATAHALSLSLVLTQTSNSTIVPLLCIIVCNEDESSAEEKKKKKEFLLLWQIKRLFFFFSSLSLFPSTPVACCWWGEILSTPQQQRLTFRVLVWMAHVGKKKKRSPGGKIKKSTAELLLVPSLYIHSSGRLPTNTPKENETTCLEDIPQKLTFFRMDGRTVGACVNPNNNSERYQKEKSKFLWSVGRWYAYCVLHYNHPVPVFQSIPSNK